MPCTRTRRRSAVFSGLAAIVAHFFGSAPPPQEQKTQLTDPQRREQPRRQPDTHSDRHDQ
ncbi:MAG: hypothetical protein ACF8QF_05280 [Phycisphaerales bacterium]